jgi:hypothetical protein
VFTHIPWTIGYVGQSGGGWWWFTNKLIIIFEVSIKQEFGKVFNIPLCQSWNLPKLAFSFALIKSIFKGTFRKGGGL